MSTNVQKADRVAVLKRSLSEASEKVQRWGPSKHASAEATVDPKRLASYYESPVRTRKK